ncbi:25b47abe-3111-4d47-b8a6-6496d51a7e3f [Sclerotinia trifoliorum]|uniref:25b47abe-3111-4d47-b8a6-6496d51a7e3f n=1 Tax=Sclerotinia trifoliorum TaxID=28548 RepID=A0A8H2ZNM0_9HELO|nr:25b47abe-3111-4d47-b8a6-6496d51a7e3f [Sclerotinia trifoliorum]
MPLGELYLKMEGRWEDARRFLEHADAIRGSIDDFDAACTRDNLGQLWEIKGDMVKAKAARERDPNSIVCSNFNCSLSSANVKSERENLKNCARCKATWYCSAQCQKVDWRSRHKKWCKEPQKLSAEQTSTSG